MTRLRAGGTAEPLVSIALIPCLKCEQAISLAALRLGRGDLSRPASAKRKSYHVASHQMSFGSCFVKYKV